MKSFILLAALLLTFAHAQTTLTFWHSFGDNEAMTTLLEEFNTSHDDVQVEGVDVGNYNEMITRLQAAVVSGRVPDVVQLEITRYGIFADREVLLPLDDFISSTDFNVDDLIPGIWEATQYQGTPYVIPFNNSVPVMYYNKDLFREAGLDPENPPATWDELVEAANTLTVQENGETVQYGLSAPPQWVRHAFVRQNRRRLDERSGDGADADRTRGGGGLQLLARPHLRGRGRLRRSGHRRQRRPLRPGLHLGPYRYRLYLDGQPGQLPGGHGLRARRSPAPLQRGLCGSDWRRDLRHHRQHP